MLELVLPPGSVKTLACRLFVFSFYGLNLFRGGEILRTTRSQIRFLPTLQSSLTSCFCLRCRLKRFRRSSFLKSPDPLSPPLWDHSSGILRTRRFFLRDLRATL